MDMDIVTWCRWRTSTLFFFDGTFQSQNKTKLNAQNNISLGLQGQKIKILVAKVLHRHNKQCRGGDILVVVHSNFAFKSSMTTLLLIDHLVGRGDLEQ
jgi:hypothetical protein